MSIHSISTFSKTTILFPLGYTGILPIVTMINMNQYNSVIQKNVKYVAPVDRIPIASTIFVVKEIPPSRSSQYKPIIVLKAEHPTHDCGPP
jgi:hypothetical protein